MLTKFRVLPYSPYSNSAHLLADALGGKRIKLQGSKYVYTEGDVVINWGNRRLAGICTLNNNADLLTRASNKLYFFQDNREYDWCPEFWTNAEEIPDSAFPILCRTVLNGHSGQGIVYSRTRDDLVPCSLYVKYVPKKDEYRVHLGISDTVTTIAIQQKKRKLEYAEPNWKVRNHANGFVYAREGVDPPARVLSVATDCFLRSGLDFGAVDLGFHPDYGVKVYEINTAPGLEGQTLEDYATFFRRFA